MVKIRPAAIQIGLLSLCLSAPDPMMVAQNSGQRAAASGQERMLQLLEAIREETPDENRYLGDVGARRLRRKLEELPQSTDALQKAELRYQLGEAEIRLGHEGKAISHYKTALDLLPTRPGSLHSNAISTHFRLGVAYLRLGETQNCCLRNNPESCILPIRGSGVHREQEGSNQAIVHLRKVLEHTNKGSRAYMQALWLFNLAHMTLDRQTDEAFRIPPEAFDSEEVFPRFSNIAPRLGLNTFSLAGGVIADDFDNDDRLDLIVSTSDPAGPIRYFRNNGTGGFSDLTREAGLEGILGGLNIVQADYDSDGHLDVFVLRGAWNYENGRHPNSLLRNNGDGTFRDVTFEAGLGKEHFPTQTASWGDYDRDGDLDLYVGNESFGSVSFPCQLFRNNGDGTFTDTALQSGVANGRFTKAVVWGDYDADDWPDLYVSNYRGANRLYRNQGNGTFVDMAPQLGVDGPWESFPAWFWDYNNDGRLDLYVSAYKASGAEVAANYLNEPVSRDMLARLYQGDGQGGFKDVAREVNLLRPNAPMGSNFGDIDSDGYLDFYLGTGWPEYEAIMPNLLYWNIEGRRFADVTQDSGLGHLQKGHGVAFADFDNDGDQDVFEQMGGFYAGDKFFDCLYENPGFKNHWITVQLVGVESNRSAIGARIRVDVIEAGQTRSVYRHVNSGGTFGANPLRQTVGLGQATSIRELEVRWPTTGKSQVFKQVPMDGSIRITEGQSRIARISPR